MRNQPKYSFFKNTSYALNGLKDLLRTETSFKIEIILTFILIPIIIILDTNLVYKLLMFVSLMIVLISEATNSSIERAVDLVTLEHHPMAGRAKDVGSTIVFLSITTCVVVWGFILLDIF